MLYILKRSEFYGVLRILAIRNNIKQHITMALYSIESEQCLGMSHCGAVTVNGESAVELSDEEVNILVKLIKEKESTDIGDLDLEDLYPDIYQKLDKAYYKMAYDAEEMHWLWEGYYNGYYEYDDELMAYCEKELDFSFEFKPEEYFDSESDIEDYKEDPESYEDEINDLKYEAFSDWLSDYVEGLSDDEARDFFYDHMGVDLNMDGVEYTVGIPEAIISKAQGK